MMGGRGAETSGRGVEMSMLVSDPSLLLSPPLPPLWTLAMQAIVPRVEKKKNIGLKRTVKAKPEG